MHVYDLRKCDLRCHCKAPIGSVQPRPRSTLRKVVFAIDSKNSFHYTRNAFQLIYAPLSRSTLSPYYNHGRHNAHHCPSPTPALSPPFQHINPTRPSTLWLWPSTPTPPQIRARTLRKAPTPKHRRFQHAQTRRRSAYIPTKHPHAYQSISRLLPHARFPRLAIPTPDQPIARLSGVVVRGPGGSI
jgi:hypothetical protein